jgi:uncharacterized protein with von Willebrand factor type A (vWA) domain
VPHTYPHDYKLIFVGDAWNIRQLMGGRMYRLTLEGLDSAMRELVR